MIPLPHSGGPPVMPAPVDGCALCRRLDRAWRTAYEGKPSAEADTLARAFVAHRQRHRAASG
ncbi:hypothetical protein AC230_04140 [Streptomyces caatingaensis]|uniref:Uncharacterized protein n=1 Tax=Streptomyces caatingaensis TaxID=1678637 RepID=A0A0K9XKH0_9ACTN|nr:hypothetical protein AC230_04140 [Streptomyces caatingaensis]